MSTLRLIRLDPEDSDWLFHTAISHFQELVPEGPGPPRAEIDHWMTDTDLVPLKIDCDGARVGFALVERMDGFHELCEFRISPTHRGAGLGGRAAIDCFALFPGRWSLGVASALPGTARFWDRLLLSTGSVTQLERGPVLTPYQSHSYTFTFTGAP
ncbi:MAG: hypothetical protein AAF727_03110 [Pseudomonadota bacterium]